LNRPITSCEANATRGTPKIIVTAYLDHELAVIPHLEFGQTLGVFLNEISQAVQEHPAIAGEHLGPWAQRECSVGSADGAIDIVRIRSWQSRPGLAAVRVLRFEPAS